MEWASLAWTANKTAKERYPQDPQKDNPQLHIETWKKNSTERNLSCNCAFWFSSSQLEVCTISVYFSWNSFQDQGLYYLEMCLLRTPDHQFPCHRQTSSLTPVCFSTLKQKEQYHYTHILRNRTELNECKHLCTRKWVITWARMRFHIIIIFHRSRNPARIPISFGNTRSSNNF